MAGVHVGAVREVARDAMQPDICTPIEGKVYSITGNTPGWPKLPMHTPFHVGCRHVETPFVDTFLSDEKIAELQALSNQAEPAHVYTPEQLAAADAKRAQRERGRKMRKEREAKNAAAVASGKKKPVQAVREEVAASRIDEEPVKVSKDWKGSNGTQNTQGQLELPLPFDGPGAAPNKWRRGGPNKLIFEAPKGDWIHSQTVDQMERWVSRNSEKWEEATPDDELDAVRKYKGEEIPKYPGQKFYKVINRLLRGDLSVTRRFPPKMVGEARQMIPLIASSVQRGRLERNTILYRGFGSRSRKLTFTEGNEVTELGFMSTSLSRDQAELFATQSGYNDGGFIAEILVPKGTPAAFPDRIGEYQGQNEVILAPGTKLRVLKVQPPEIEGGPTKLLLEVIPDA